MHKFIAVQGNWPGLHLQVRASKRDVSSESCSVTSNTELVLTSILLVGRKQQKLNHIGNQQVEYLNEKQVEKCLVLPPF